MIIPVAGQFLALTLPEGYEPFIQQDDVDSKIIGLEHPQAPVYILRVMPVGEGLQAGFAPGSEDRAENIALLEQSATMFASHDHPGALEAQAFLEEGLLGLPGGWMYSQDGAFVIAYTAFEHCLVALSAVAQGNNAPKPTIEDVLGMLLLLIQQP